MVTGGSAGVGRATVCEFAARGYDVAILARGGAGLDGAAADVRSRGRRALPLEVDVALLPEAAVVADLVYVPLVTPLLAVARARGLRTADGLGMLLHQAVRGFELWFGRRPEVTAELRALVEADLTKT